MENKYSLKITPTASKDLDVIYKYIKDELCNPKAANDLFDKIEKAFEILQDFPKSCPECVQEREYRKLIVGNYIAFYKISEQQKQVAVYRVLYGMMDYHNYI